MMAQTHTESTSQLVVVFLENITSFLHFFSPTFAVFASEHVAVGIVFFSVQSAVKLKQVQIANNAAKLTTSARRGSLTWRMITSCGLNLSITCSLYVFSSMFVHRLWTLIRQFRRLWRNQLWQRRKELQASSQYSAAGVCLTRLARHDWICRL